MKTLEELGLKEAEIKALNRRKIYNSEQLSRLVPRKFIDYTKIVDLSPLVSGTNIATIGKFIKWEKQYSEKTKSYYTKATLIQNGHYLNIYWYRNGWIGSAYFDKYIGKNVLVCGKVEYNAQYNNYTMVSAYVKEEVTETFIETVYTTIKGIKDDKLKKAIAKSLEEKYGDILPDEIRTKYGFILEDHDENLKKLHFPKSMEDVAYGNMRVLFDHLLYFALRLAEEDVLSPKGTIYQVNTTEDMEKYIGSLPYELTNAQRTTINGIIDKMKDSKRVRALVQGDVGCGKTTVAFSVLLAAASNGFQSCLMAPTVALATQHYLELKEVCDKLGYTVCFYGGQLTAKEKKKMLSDIKEGICQIVVGTQGVTNCEFKNLGLVIADEEQKFGVKQREALIKAGVHSISMTATPIPRSIANTIYGDTTDVYVINELPKNRLPIKTYLLDNEEAIIKSIDCELSKGHQAYVVCPLVEECESNEKFADLSDTKRVLSVYEKAFPNEKIAVVTGKTKKEELNNTLNDFRSGKIKILIATTVIEVGFSVPNATIMAVYNAERFGLSTLHQIRGRVGRGSLQSYCLLQSADSTNPRLLKMCETNDGFEIAKKDLELRGVGDILGDVQSGKNFFVELALKYPKHYATVKNVAKDLIKGKSYKAFLDKYENRYNIENS